MDFYIYCILRLLYSNMMIIQVVWGPLKCYVQDVSQLLGSRELFVK